MDIPKLPAYENMVSVLRRSLEQLFSDGKMLDHENIRIKAMIQLIDEYIYRPDEKSIDTRIILLGQLIKDAQRSGDQTWLDENYPGWVEVAIQELTELKLKHTPKTKLGVEQNKDIARLKERDHPDMTYEVFCNIYCKCSGKDINIGSLRDAASKLRGANKPAPSKKK